MTLAPSSLRPQDQDGWRDKNIFRRFGLRDQDGWRDKNIFFVASASGIKMVGVTRTSSSSLRPQGSDGWRDKNIFFVASASGIRWLADKEHIRRFGLRGKRVG